MRHLQTVSPDPDPSDPRREETAAAKREPIRTRPSQVRGPKCISTVQNEAQPCTHFQHLGLWRGNQRRWRCLWRESVLLRDSFPFLGMWVGFASPHGCSGRLVGVEEEEEEEGGGPFLSALLPDESARERER